MVSPERLNVLLSRARNGLILIGNVQTFLKARTNNDVWVRFFELMRRGGYVHDGFPVKCERHPDKNLFYASQLILKTIAQMGVVKNLGQSTIPERKLCCIKLTSIAGLC